MNKKNFKKIGIIISLFYLILFPSKISMATDGDLDVDGFNIMPQLSDEEIGEVNEAIKDIGTTGRKVRDTYNQKASELSTPQQVASGIMNWDTIMNYLVFIVQFLSQLGLLVGALFIIYAGYKYMTNVLVGSKSVPSTAIKNAIIGVIIVIFSFAIMRVLTSFIGLT